jgi:hypothetical protein
MPTMSFPILDDGPSMTLSSAPDPHQSSPTTTHPHSSKSRRAAPSFRTSRHSSRTRPVQEPRQEGREGRIQDRMQTAYLATSSRRCESLFHRGNRQVHCEPPLVPLHMPIHQSYAILDVFSLLSACVVGSPLKSPMFGLGGHGLEAAPERL